MRLIDALRQSYQAALVGGQIPFGWSMDRNALAQLRREMDDDGNLTGTGSEPTLFGLPISDRAKGDGMAELLSAKPDSAPDAVLVKAYQRTNRRPGDAYTDALIAEIERRNLDI